MCKGLRGQSNGYKPRLEYIWTFLHEHASLQVSNKSLNSKNIVILSQLTAQTKL